MKTSLLFFIAASLATSLASAAEYSVFRVCQDQRVIHTSDGADAGHVEYIVVDPSNRQVVSTVVTGGVVGERLVAVPYDSMRFTSDREITLNQITREEFVSAPVIERTQISAAVIQPDIIQRTTTHFSARTGGEAERTTVSGSAETRSRESVQGRADMQSGNRDPRVENRASGTAADVNPADPQAAARRAESDRQREQRQGDRTPGTGANVRDKGAASAREQGNRPETTDTNARDERGHTPPQAERQGKENAAAQQKREENAAAQKREENAPAANREENAPGKPQARREQGAPAENAAAELEKKAESPSRNAREEGARSNNVPGEKSKATEKRESKEKNAEPAQEKRKQEPQI